MKTKNCKALSDLGITLEEISAYASKRFEGIYILDISNNKVIAIKSFYEEDYYEEPVVHDWDSNILEEVNKSMAPKYRSLALVTFDRQHLRKKFSDIKQHAEFVYQRNNGVWNSVTFQPLKIEDGDCLAILVTFVDISDSKKRLDTMSQQMELFHKDIRSLNWYFSQVAQNMYSEILKVDLLSSEVSNIIFEDNEAKEIPLMDVDTIYEKIFETIHPKDLAEAKEKFSFDRLKAMNPGDVISGTFRRYIDNKYQWYNVSVHVSDVEPSIAVVFARNISSSGFETNQIMSKAEHDDLTDLFNIEKYAYLIATEYTNLKSAGVIYADIQGLSELNEKYGREFGTEAIKIVADSFRSVQNRSALAYRCGDDEFMLIAVGASKEDVAVLMQLIKERFSRLCDIKNTYFFTSFGSSWAENVEDIASVITDAVNDMRNNKNLEILR